MEFYFLRGPSIIDMLRVIFLNAWGHGSRAISLLVRPQRAGGKFGKSCRLRRRPGGGITLPRKTRPTLLHDVHQRAGRDGSVPHGNTIPGPALHPCPEGNQRNRGRVSVALCSNAASSLEQGRIRAQLKAKRERKRTEIHGEQCLFLNPSPAPNSSALLPQPVFMCLFLSLAADATRPSSRSQRAAMSSHVPSGPSSAHLAPQDLGLESQSLDPT